MNFCQFHLNVYRESVWQYNPCLEYTSYLKRIKVFLFVPALFYPHHTQKRFLKRLDFKQDLRCTRSALLYGPPCELLQTEAFLEVEVCLKNCKLSNFWACRKEKGK